MAITVRNPDRGYEYRRAEQRVSQDGFRELRNAELYAPGVISKRDGFPAASNAQIDEDATPVPGDLAGVGYLEDELVRLQDQDLYTYVANADRWSRMGPWPLVVSSETTSITRPTSIRTAGAAVLDGYRVTVWQEVSDAGDFSIWADVEATAGGHIQRFLIIDAESTVYSQPRAINCGNWIAVTYWSPNVDPAPAIVYVHRWQPDKPTALSGSITLTTSKGYDLIGAPDREELWVARLVPGVQLTEVHPDLTINRDRALAAFIGPYTALALDRWTDTTEFLIAAVDPGGPGVARWFLDDLTQIASYPLINATRVTCVLIDAARGTVAVENVTAPHVEVLNVFRTGVSTPPFSPIHRAFGLGLAGRAVAWNGEAYIISVLPDGLVNGTSFAESISGYFVFRARDLAIVARAWPLGQATTYGGRFLVSELHQGAAIYTADGVEWTLTVRTAFREPDAAARSPSGFEELGAEVVGTLALDFVSARAKTVESHGIATWPAGGYLRGYDSRRTFEVDFHTPPAILAFADSGLLDPGEIEPGDYGYAVTYIWRDENGHRYRSMVGTAQHTVPGAAPAGIVDVDVRTARQTERDDIQIELWRTTKAGTTTSTTYFLVSDPSNPPLNNVTAAFVTVRDQTPDALIVGNEQLQLEPVGPLLAHDIVQVSGFAARAGERLWSRSSSRPNRVYASQFAGDSDGVAMSSLLRVDLDTVAPARGLAIQDGSFFAGAGDGVHVFTGRGLDNAGAGQSFTPAIAIPSTEGCSLLGGMIRTGIGVLYASDDGPSLVARDQTISGLTDGVRELYRDTAADITDLAWHPDESEIWLGDADEGQGALSLNTETLRWSRHDGMLTRAMAISRRGNMAIARNDGRVLIRGNQADTRVAGVDTPLVVMPGFQRPSAGMLIPYSLTAIGLVLLYHGPHLLHVELYLDDDPDTVRGTVTIDPDRDGLRNPPGWGELAEWGSPEPWGWADGWPGNAYYTKIQINAPVIRSAAIRLQDAGTTGQGWSYVQSLWAWEPRTSTNAIDEGDPRGRRRYYLAVV